MLTLNLQYASQSGVGWWVGATGWGGGAGVHYVVINCNKLVDGARFAGCIVILIPFC